MPTYVAPRHLPAKATYGSPCNQCGRCCFSRPCEIARAVFGPAEPSLKLEPCPALEVTEGGYRCGMMVHPLRYAPGLRMRGGAALAAAARLLLSAGLGCDQRYGDEVASPAFDQKRATYRTKHAVALGKARRLWGLSS